MKLVQIKEIDKFGSTHDSQQLTVCRLILRNYRVHSIIKSEHAPSTSPSLPGSCQITTTTPSVIERRRAERMSCLRLLNRVGVA